MQYPDYESGIVNLSNSILRSFGAQCRHKTLPVLDTILDKGFQNVALLLFDGMGTDALKTHLQEDSFLREHLVKSISSVFPPTTAAATTSIMSGLTPYEHGWLGWSLYFKEIDKIVDLYPNTVKDSNGVQAADYHVARTLIPFESIGSAIERAGYGRMAMVAPFGENAVTGQKEFFNAIRTICGEPGRKFVYGYWPQPDGIMHETGCRSKRTEETIFRINQSVKELCRSLSDTVVIVTADHGHIDTHYQFVADHPQLAQSLIRPISIESRAAAFYVKDEYKKQFPKIFRETVGQGFLLLTRNEVIKSGLFGNGARHLRFAESLGDYLAISIADVALVYSRESKQFVSNHAGLTAMEMDVPLMIIERPAV